MSEILKRDLCYNCLQFKADCYCASIKPFHSNLKFVILIHPLEAKRRLGTGRMAHLLLKESELIRGSQFEGNRRVQDIIDNPNHRCLVLLPGEKSRRIDCLSPIEKLESFCGDRKLVIFVIDGLWTTVKKTMKMSPTLNNLPKICFSPMTPSKYRVRKQPKKMCLSTIESIYEVIVQLAHVQGFDLSRREHDRLLELFQLNIERQVDDLKGRNCYAFTW